MSLPVSRAGSTTVPGLLSRSRHFFGVQRQVPQRLHRDDVQLHACGQSVAEALSGGVLGPDPVTCALDLTTCDSSLGTCSGNLSSTNADLGMCTSSLTTATGSLTTCNANYATCSGSLATANAGTASVGDVLSGKTFTSAAGLGATGTMANNGSVTLTPTTSAQSIAAGYHDGTGSCAGDADLVAGNIKSGVNLVGVNGSSSVVNTSGATAAAADMLSGKTAYVSGSLVTGVVAAGASVGGSNGSKTFTIPDGLYSGSKTATANDTDLAAGNIASGVNIFGVVGTMAAGSAGAQTLNTGQTLCYDAAGAEIACAGTGQDGELRKGATRSFTDNGDGTITDNTTGLMWEKQSDDGSIHDKDNTYTWANAFASKVATLNGGAGFAGYTDWRVPNRNESLTLTNVGAYNPASYSAFNTSCAASCTVLTCSCGLANTYWSSSTYQSLPSTAWYITYYFGLAGNGNKTSSYAVRAVRAGS